MFLSQKRAPLRGLDTHWRLPYTPPTLRLLPGKFLRYTAINALPACSSPVITGAHAIKRGMLDLAAAWRELRQVYWESGRSMG